MVEQTEITALLSDWRSGDEQAEEELVRRLYPMVRSLALRQLSTGSNRLTLQATDLVNETFIKLFGQNTEWKNRQHFMAVAARVIRRVIIDYVRSRTRQKRGGDAIHLTIDRLEERLQPKQESNFDWLLVDQLLEELEEADKQAVQLIELRYFAGLTVEEAAEVMEISRASVVRLWRNTRAWLMARMGE